MLERLDWVRSRLEELLVHEWNRGLTIAERAEYDELCMAELRLLRCGEAKPA